MGNRREKKRRKQMLNGVEQQKRCWWKNLLKETEEEKSGRKTNEILRSVLKVCAVCMVVGGVFYYSTIEMLCSV